MLTTFTTATFVIALGIQGAIIEKSQTTSPQTPKQEKVRATPSKHTQNRTQKALRTKLKQNR